MTKQGNVSIQQHPLNYEESVALRDKMGDRLEVNQCYSNVFHAISYSNGKFASGEWKVAYGYIQLLQGATLMARHCFIVNSDGEAIDPTLMNISGFKKGEERGHVSFAVFEDYQTYLDAISENNYTPDLIRHFRQLEQSESQAWAQENNVVLIG